MMKNTSISAIFLQFYASFIYFYTFLCSSCPEKYHKIRKARENPKRFNTVFSNQQVNETTGQQGNKSISRRVEKCAEYKCPLMTYSSSPDTTSNIIS